jgi:RNA polymerase sigma factor (sigma-70 family)
VTFSSEDLLRELAPQVLGAVVRRFRDFAAAEDAVQEALVAATVQWPEQGVPSNPRGWLIHVAARRMTDQIRADLARRRRESYVVSHATLDERVAPSPDSSDGVEDDDALVLLFMCCHPALTRASAIALTLRAVGGLTTAEIASAFLVPEATMAQRISRAKKQIRTSGVPFQMPGPQERGERLEAVLHVLYLVFNEGYATSSGPDLQRRDLASEAIRLARTVYRLLPDHAEVAGLLALMLLTDARRHARTGADGELVALDAQDRTLWDREAIAEGTALITRTMARGAVGAYQLQAAIAALHDEAARAEDTDWIQILALYGLLERMSDNPMVTLNRAIATAMVHGPQAGLDLLATLDGDERMAGHHRLDAVRAHLLEKAGNPQLAVRHFLAAAERATSIPERNYLRVQAARLATALAAQGAPPFPAPPGTT